MNHIDRRIMLLILLVLQLAGCGFQLYLVHRNRALNQSIKHSLQTIEDAKRNLDEAERRVLMETERLQGLMKMLPSQPSPDRRSKL